MDHTLFTYRNLEELRKIQEEREVFAFMFGDKGYARFLF